MTTFGGHTIPPIFGGGASGFTIPPIRSLNSDSSFTRPAGDNRNFGVAWRSSGSQSGATRYGDSFIPAYDNASVANQPNWHQDAPNAIGGGFNGTLNFELAVLQVIDSPVDLPVVLFTNLLPPVIGQYNNMGTSPTYILRTLGSDPVGFIRTFEMLMSIRRVSDLMLMAEFTTRFTAIRS